MHVETEHGSESDRSDIRIEGSYIGSPRKNCMIKLEENYKELHDKFDVLAGDITQLVDFNTEYTKQFEAKSEKDAKVFEKMEEFLSSTKENLSKVDLSNQSTISQ